MSSYIQSGMPTVESAFGDESLLELSIVVAAYNDWLALESCLGSIAPQANGPRFEVVVIDDGSDIPAPSVFANGHATSP